MTNEDGFLTYQETALLLGRSRPDLYYWQAKGFLHPVTIYGRRLLARAEVRKLQAHLESLASTLSQGA